jgi:hypothetical protein
MNRRPIPRKHPLHPAHANQAVGSHGVPKEGHGVLTVRRVRHFLDQFAPQTQPLLGNILKRRWIHAAVGQIQHRPIGPPAVPPFFLGRLDEVVLKGTDDGAHPILLSGATASRKRSPIWCQREAPSAAACNRSAHSAVTFPNLRLAPRAEGHTFHPPSEGRREAVSPLTSTNAPR